VQTFLREILARDLGVTLSVGRRGQCWDNAVAESFFATVKTELIHRRPWPTRRAATRPCPRIATAKGQVTLSSYRYCSRLVWAGSPAQAKGSARERWVALLGNAVAGFRINETIVRVLRSKPIRGRFPPAGIRKTPLETHWF
jgi:transposase InsO family protein